MERKSWKTPGEDIENQNKDFIEERISELEKKIEKNRKSSNSALDQQVKCGVQDESIQEIIENISGLGVNIQTKAKLKAVNRPEHFIKALEYFFHNLDNMDQYNPKFLYYSDYEEEKVSKFKIELRVSEEDFEHRHKFRESLDKALEIHGVQNMSRDVFLRVRISDEN